MDYACILGGVNIACIWFVRRVRIRSPLLDNLIIQYLYPGINRQTFQINGYRYVENYERVNGMPKQTPARKKANQKYLATQDDIKVRVPKGKRTDYADFAKAHGMSLNKFVIEAIEEKMEREK